VTRGRGQHPTRAAILDALTAEGVSVSARGLATLLNLQLATVKYHLAVLRDEGLVEVDHVDYRSSHVEHYYRLTRKEEAEN
jgi:DNA-binding transcriptional ArsR family regulator